jgi:hypothetical protein
MVRAILLSTRWLPELSLPIHGGDMSRVPVITSPCPLRWNGAPEPGKDFCGHCQRRVHNLDLMSAGDREQFLSGCEGKVCVSYTVRRSARLPLALGVSLVVRPAKPQAA